MKVKRIMSLILAMVMVLSFMAMSASAATTEVQPRGTCPQCINGYVETKTEMLHNLDYYFRNKKYFYTTCSKQSVSHAHYNVEYGIRATCRNCGYNAITYSYSGVYCPYGG